MRGLRVGLVYNLKKNIQAAPDAPSDALAEYDSADTVEALQDALSLGGHEVICLEADRTLVDSVRQSAPDICFNIAEGLRGDAREAQVPALLEMLGIPYTGSRVFSHAISLDKAACKRVWRDNGLPTAPFQVFRHGEEPLERGLAFPLFVKPLREGTGMGINGQSITRNEVELRHQVRWVIDSYAQPALVEGYLPGREFTVGLFGNALLPGEVRWNSLYDEQGYHVLPVMEIDSHKGAGQGLYTYEAKSYVPGENGAPDYLCPADIPPSLEAELRQLTITAFEAISAQDISRVDFRLGRDGRPYLMEVNTLPGLNPVVSDQCIMARAEGLDYAVMINEVLHLAAARHARENMSFKALRRWLASVEAVEAPSLVMMSPSRVGGK